MLLLLLLLLLFFFGREGLHASTGIEKSSEGLTLLSMPLSTHSAAQHLSAHRRLAVCCLLGGALTQGDGDHLATDDLTLSVGRWRCLLAEIQAEPVAAPALLHVPDGFVHRVLVVEDDGLCLVLSRL